MFGRWCQEDSKDICTCPNFALIKDEMKNPCEYLTIFGIWRMMLANKCCSLIWPAIIGLIGRSRYHTTWAHQPRGVVLANSENALYILPPPASHSNPGPQWTLNPRPGTALLLGLSIIKTTVWYVNWKSPSSSLIFKVIMMTSVFSLQPKSPKIEKFGSTGHRSKFRH